MTKSMIDLYNEIGPQGWYDDPVVEEDNQGLIDKLEDQLSEIEDELEIVAGEKEELDEKEEILLSRANAIKKELDKLRGNP